MLEKINSPHLKLSVVAVAGTNGKGSVSAAIESILRKCSKKTGLFTSPHLFDFTERIKINNISITKTALKPLLRSIRKGEVKAGVSLSRFEIITAAAILYFHRKKCDISIMEAGLGGRLDSTNICENKLVSIITPVSLEHTQYLGNTIHKIANEQAGIIKENSIVVDFSGVDIISKIAHKRNCVIYTQGKDYEVQDIKYFNDGRYSFTYFSKKMTIKNLKPGLRGIHQCYNAAAAITAVLALGIESYIKEGIFEMTMPGRMEIFTIAEGRKLLIDVAHNPHSFQVLFDFLNSWRPKGASIFLIMGVYKDKDYKNMVKIITQLIEKAWTITTDKSTRALDGKNLAAFFNGKAEFMPDFKTAHSKAVSLMKSGDRLVVSGSFSVARSALEAINA